MNTPVTGSTTTYAKEVGRGWHRVAPVRELGWNAACGRVRFPHPEQPSVLVELSAPPSPYCLDCDREDQLDRSQPTLRRRLLLTAVVLAGAVLAAEWLDHTVTLGVWQNFTP
jgi:hypothetical protein